MNGLGLILIVITLSLLTIKWLYTWRAGRRYMNNRRIENGKKSIDALANNWDWTIEKKSTGIGLDLDKLGKEHGLTQEEMLQAYEKAERTVRSKGKT